MTAGGSGYSAMQAQHAGNGATGKGNQPTGINGQTDSMKDPVNNLGFSQD